MNSTMPTHFLTAEGTEVPAITAGQMRELDRIATEETGPNLFQMMENAGRSAAKLVIELLGKNWDKGKVLVLAGSGGNGGGGICAARHLANHGVDVSLCLSQPSHLKEVTSWQQRIFRSSSGREVQKEELANCAPNLILDALIGYGLDLPPQGGVVGLIRWANKSGAPILSLDIPSGVHATTGRTAGVFIKAQWTLSLALPKTGLLSGEAGRLFLADLGIPEGTYLRMGLGYKPPFGRHFWIPLVCS